MRTSRASIGNNDLLSAHHKVARLSLRLTAQRERDEECQEPRQRAEGKTVSHARKVGRIADFIEGKSFREAPVSALPVEARGRRILIR
jgi:hypothetical protein